MVVISVNNNGEIEKISIVPIDNDLVSSSFITQTPTGDFIPGGKRFLFYFFHK